MISVTGLELRAGSRILLSDTTLRVQPGDRIGLVGRNGAGKTTTLKVLAGEGQPYSGEIDRRSAIGYLPQDPRTGDLEVTGRDRVLSARGLDVLMAQMKEIEQRLADGVDDKLVRRYGALEDQFASLGGYAAEAEAARICANLGLPDRALAQTIGTLSGGQRRRIELARILFRDAGENGGGILLLDEPTNHLDADSITWLRGFLANHKGGLIVISHDGSLLESVVNKVWFLDATRSVVDVYNLGWKAYQEARETDERRRRRERANAEKKAGALMAQADKMRAKATKTVAAQNMARRAEKLIAGLEEVRVSDKVAKVRFPNPAPCGKTPLTATGLSKSYGSLEIFTDVNVAVDRGSRVAILGLNGAGKTTLLRMLGGLLPPDTGEVHAGHGLRLGYYAQEHETLDVERTVLENMRAAAIEQSDTDLRKILGAFLFSGEDVNKPAGVLSGGEKTRLALSTLVCSGANVLLLDEPTNNLDPVSREQVLDAIANYPGAIVLVTHDPGAVLALKPDRAILLPDGDEDAWSDDLLELVELA
ncbi:ABC-F family ATP-binding cassette domain-containing protein [Micromonospora rifamycinica]|uniref:ATPase components of ABC transporters with duplicated ATPase domains n=1 Tax=Micromonospora rifamycinica TaxID=291594 RepID=A0A109IMP7_9ACTN|nr:MULTISPECIES: ABC-F family ATP-binding cassette domain-containing protein [Micromonospora]KWV33383.1 ABC transporter [Micromonospora rifamycinica]WFE66889.1 ABC-F family ATP-binding cassette domain-containing protein [Micromonospora sp. WMMD714]SCG81231.1 ATPase components of ABC transporters with duplicated ATPase domains [Micromonospora rifamycinica]